MKNDFFKIMCLFALTIATISGSANDKTEHFAAWWKTSATTSVQSDRQLQKRSATTSTPVTFRLFGRCYAGPGTSVPIKSGQLKVCFKQDQSNDFSSTTCSDWSQVSWMCQLDSSGAFSITRYPNPGNYHAAVYLPPYALQWWDGKPLSEQPTPIAVTRNDSLQLELHFTDGCRIDGAVSVQQDTLPGTPMPTISLFDTTGIALFTTYTNNTGTFSFTGIPPGAYYLGSTWISDYENPFYPGVAYADGAYKVVFSRPETRRMELPWVLKRKPSVPSFADTSGHLIITSADSGYSSIAIVQRFIGSSRVSYSSTSNDTLEKDIAANRKVLIARTNSSLSPQELSLEYYPGSPLRSEAETLSLDPNELRVLSFPSVQSGRISGRFPVFNYPDISFFPMLVSPGSYVSLCAEPYTDSVGFFTLCAPPGLFSLWFIPITNNYFRTANEWGAFRKDSIIVVDNQTTWFHNLTAPDLDRTIEGTISAYQDPVLVCFDSLNRPMSIAAISVYTYFKDRTQGRWRCFTFSNIFAPPYSFRFALNSLPPGKYAVVKAEPPDSQPGPFTISWYGGPSLKLTIMDIDDVASLPVPRDVEWVIVDSTSTVVDLGTWAATSTIHDLRNRNFHLQRPNIRSEHDKIFVTLPGWALIASVRIFTITGRLVATQVINEMQQGTLQVPIHNPAAQVLVVSVHAGGTVYRQTVIPASFR